jgi:crotonobetainyl-CoA:carnitine CoA-transferase CaiB-like acyl-CoA transferase
VSRDAPLAGVKVADFGQLLGAPTAAMVLAELGADVVKVEPFRGDAGRELQTAAFAGTSTSPTFLAFNRGKRSIALDLAVPAAQEVARRLVERADVVIESFRPGALAKFGLGADDVRRLNPRAVYASLSGFGATGPDRDRRGVDIVIQAESGIMAVTGERGGPPLKVGFTVVDVAAGNVLAHAILAALYRRERTGEGDVVEVSLLEVALHLQAAPLTEYLATGVVPARAGNAAPMTAPADLMRTGDGFLVLSAYLDDHWRRFCRRLGRPDLIDDERYATKVARLANRQELLETIEETLATRTTREWVEAFEQDGLLVGTVKDYAEIEQAPQVAANGSILELPRGDGTTFRTIRAPARFRGWQPSPPLPPPEIGQHTREVLAELGYPEREVEELLAGGAAA